MKAMIESGKGRTLLALGALALALILVACAERSSQLRTHFSSKPDFHGSFNLSVWKAVAGSPDGYSSYEVNLDQGTISVAETRALRSVTEIQIPADAVDARASKWTISGVRSPNGKYLASWLPPAPDGNKVLRISEPATHAEYGAITIPSGSNIASVAWSADSLYLVVVIQNEKTHYGLGWVFGHGIPESDFDARVFSVGTRDSLLIPLVRGVPFSAVAYVQWSLPAPK